MLIGKVSKLYQVPIDTLRYYDRTGLLRPERQGDRRRYGAADLAKLAAILKMKKLFFTLEEIKIILFIDAEIDKGIEAGAFDPVPARKLLALIGAKLGDMETMAAEIQEIMSELGSLAAKVKTTLEAQDNG